MPTPPKPNVSKSTDANKTSRASESLGGSEFDSLADELSSFSEGLFESEDELKALDRPMSSVSRPSLPASRNAAPANKPSPPKPPSLGLPSPPPLPTKPPPFPKASAASATPKAPPLPATKASSVSQASRDPFAGLQNDPFAGLQNDPFASLQSDPFSGSGAFANHHGLDESFLPKPSPNSLNSSAPIPKDTMQVQALVPPTAPPPLFSDDHEDPAETQREIKKPNFASAAQHRGPKEVLNNPPDELWLPVEGEKESNRSNDRVFTIDDVPNMPSRGSRPPSRPPSSPNPFSAPSAASSADTGDSTMMSPHALQPNDFRSQPPPNPFSSQGQSDSMMLAPDALEEDEDEGDSTMHALHDDIDGDDDGDRTMLAPNLLQTEAAPSHGWEDSNAWQDPSSNPFAAPPAQADDWYGFQDALHSPEELSPSSSSHSIAGFSSASPSGSYAQPPPSRSGSYAQPPQLRSGSYTQPPQLRSGSYAQPPQPHSGSYAQPPQPHSGSYAQPPQPHSGSYAQPHSGSYAQAAPFSGGSYAPAPSFQTDPPPYPRAENQPFQQPSASYQASPQPAIAPPPHVGPYAQSGSYAQPPSPQGGRSTQHPFAAHPATPSGAYPQPAFDPATAPPDGSGSHSYPHQIGYAQENNGSLSYSNAATDSQSHLPQIPTGWPSSAPSAQPPALPVVGRGGTHARGGVPVATSRSSASLDSLHAVQPSRSAPSAFDQYEAEALIAEAEEVARAGAGASHVGPAPQPEKKRGKGLVVLLLLVLVTFGTIASALFAFRFWDRKGVVTKDPQRRTSWIAPEVVRRQPALPPAPVVSSEPVPPIEPKTTPTPNPNAPDASAGSDASSPDPSTPLPRTPPEDTNAQNPEDTEPTTSRKRTTPRKRTPTPEDTDTQTPEDTPVVRKQARPQKRREAPSVRRNIKVASTPEPTTASGLRVSIQPACTLYEKGRSLGKTDKTLLLKRSPGTYQFLCKDPKKLLFYAFSVTIPASGQADHQKTLRPGTLHVHSRPWSMVYSKRYGKLGRSGNPITLYEGTYDLLLYKKGSLLPGPGMQLQQRVTIRPGQTTRTSVLEFPAQDDDE